MEGYPEVMSNMTLFSETITKKDWLREEGVRQDFIVNYLTILQNLTLCCSHCSNNIFRKLILGTVFCQSKVYVVILIFSKTIWALFSRMGKLNNIQIKCLSIYHMMGY